MGVEGRCSSTNLQEKLQRKVKLSACLQLVILAGCLRYDLKISANIRLKKIIFSIDGWMFPSLSVSENKKIYSPTSREKRRFHYSRGIT